MYRSSDSSDTAYPENSIFKTCAPRRRGRRQRTTKACLYYKLSFAPDKNELYLFPGASVLEVSAISWKPEVHPITFSVAKYFKKK